jgi:hypothetical protein
LSVSVDTTEASVFVEATVVSVCATGVAVTVEVAVAVGRMTV